MTLFWNPQLVPAELHTILSTLGEEYPIAVSAEKANLFFEKCDDKDRLSVKKDGEKFTVTYGNVSFAGRGTGYALAGLENEEKICFDTHGILLDCSRTMVVTPEYFKRWLRRMALLGYNMAMLYTKDAYQLPGETYFGFMRGAYSLEEVREIDAYAKKLGIEMIASIQALGHLEPVLRWHIYETTKDTDNVIMPDDEKSYALLEKMLKFWSEAFDSRRIHLGMDETHDLGRGRFMDIHGYERPFDIYNRHLNKLCEMCGKYDLQPIIWGDMYFRFGNKNQEYYTDSSQIPQDVRDAIPKCVQLAYWDYSHRDKETYAGMLQSTRSLNGHAPMMASGIHTWARLWCDFELTQATVSACIAGCQQVNCRDIVYTMWGDDGGYCEFESAFASMAWAADKAFNSEACDERISKVFSAVCGTDYFLQTELGKMEFQHSEGTLDRWTNVNTATVLWDDPLMGIVWHEMLHHGEDIWDRTLAEYRRLIKLAENKRDDRKAGYIDYAWNILNVLIRKIEFRKKLLAGYLQRDFTTLAEACDMVPALCDALDMLNDSFREQWFRGYKSYGLEIMQIRLGGLKERYIETVRRIDELESGVIDHIHELDHKYDTIGWGELRYRMIATGGWFV